MNKKITTAISTTILGASLWAFEWPVANITPEKIKTFFAQKRGNTVSSSLILESSPEKGQEEVFTPEVRCAENGKVLVVISDIADDNAFFPSTLGQAVIVAHADNILSVYGNLAPQDNDMEELSDAPILGDSQLIGLCGNSAWKEKTGGNSTVEIKLIDTKKENSINPRLLLPRLEKERSFPPTEIILENKDGKRFELNTIKSFASGSYKFYEKRNEELTPLSVSLSVNGEMVDNIDLSNIIQNDKDLYVNGMNKKYPISSLYPDEKLLLVGETKLAKGKLVLTIENTTHLGEKRMANYNITVW